MTERHFDELLSDYLDGALDWSAVEELEIHLAVCHDCSSLFEAMKEVRILLSSLPEPEPSPDLLKKLSAIADTSWRARRRRFTGFMLRPSLQPAFAWGASLLVFLTLLIFSPQGHDLQKNVERQFRQGYDTIGKLYVKAGALAEEVGSHKETLLAPLRTVGVLKKTED